MSFVEKEVKIRCGNLDRAFGAFEVLCADKLPVSATFKLRKVRDTLREYFKVYQETWNALIGEYTEPGQELKADHPRFAEWQERAERIMNEELTIPLILPTLEALETWNLKMTVQELEKVMAFGLVVEPEPPKEGA